MRFGICTASGMRPKDFRIRFLPVKDCAILSLEDAGNGVPASSAVILRPPSDSPVRRAGRWNAPRLVRGAPSHGRRAAGHASEAFTHERPALERARQMRHGNRRISRRSGDKTFAGACEAPSPQRNRTAPDQPSGAAPFRRPGHVPGHLSASGVRALKTRGDRGSSRPRPRLAGLTVPRRADEKRAVMPPPRPPNRHDRPGRAAHHRRGSAAPIGWRRSSMPPGGLPMASAGLIARRRDGSVALKIAGGEAFGPAGQRPFDLDMPFRVASVSKMIATSVFTPLAMKRRFDLDADASGPLGFRLRHPAWPDVPITTRMLLTHTSGLRNGPSYPVPLGHKLSEAFLEDGRHYDAGGWFGPPEHRPGAWFAYADVNFALVAQLDGAPDRRALRPADEQGAVPAAGPRHRLQLERRLGRPSAPRPRRRPAGRRPLDAAGGRGGAALPHPDPGDRAAAQTSTPIGRATTASSSRRRAACG